MCITNRSHIDTQELQLRAHVRAGEGGIGGSRTAATRPSAPSGNRARRDQTPCRARARTLRWHRCSGRRSGRHHRSRCRRARQRRARQLRASSSRGRMPAEKTMTSVSSELSSAKLMRWRVACHRRSRGVFARVNADAERLDLPAQHATAALVDLQCHQPGREFDDVGLQPQIEQRLGGFEAQQSAADHSSYARAAALARMASRSSMVR